MKVFERSSICRLTALFLFSTHLIVAQTTTVTLKPGAVDGKDAYFQSLNPNNNYGVHKDFDAIAWTNGGNFVLARSVVEFDLSFVPPGATIDTALLSLFNNSTSTNNSGMHSDRSGPNTAFIRRVTSAWNESTVTWNTQPSSDTTHQVLIPASTSINQDYTDINVTELVRDMIADPANSHGFLLLLQTELAYRCLIFSSSDNPNASWHPELTVTYSLCGSVTNLTEVACISYESPAGRILTESGIYADTLEGARGCDSIINIDLTVKPIDRRVHTDGPLFTALAFPAAYQWLDCNNNFTPIPGANSQQFQAVTNGSYAVEVSQNDCVDTSVCYSINYIGITENIEENSLGVFPNPSNGLVKIKAGKKARPVAATLYGITGNILKRWTFNTTSNFELSLPDPSGVYLLEVETTETKKVFRLIRQ